MRSLERAWLCGLCALVGVAIGAPAPGCTATHGDCVTKTGNPSGECPAGSVDGSVSELAKQCGIDIDCKGGGILEGNASISGVQSIDSYFRSVLRFQSEVDVVNASLRVELDGLRASLDIPPAADFAAELRARIAAGVNGELRVLAGSSSCETSGAVAWGVAARCEGDPDATTSEFACEGRCELAPSEADPVCDAAADLFCTSVVTASPCAGECKGRCASDLSAASSCPGICRGTCEGTCSLFSDDAATQCAGHCDGMCTGSCELDSPGGAPCDGACSGDCAARSTDGRCENGSVPSCQAKPGAMIQCAGRCFGEIEVPSSKLECRAAAKAEASMSAQCSLPRVEIDYQLRDGLDPQEQVKLELLVNTLRRRLPLMLMALARAERIVEAGTDLGSAGAPAVKSAAEMYEPNGDLRQQFGLLCAVKELGTVPKVVTNAGLQLSESMRETSDVLFAIGMR